MWTVLTCDVPPFTCSSPCSPCPSTLPTCPSRYPIPASSDTVESEGRHMKQCWISIRVKKPPFENVILLAVFRIYDILVWIRSRGSMPLTNGSGFGSGSCYFRHLPSKREQKSKLIKKVFLVITFWRYIYVHHFSKIKSKKKKSQNSKNQDFSFYFCLMIEGSGSGTQFAWNRVQLHCPGGFRIRLKLLWKVSDSHCTPLCRWFRFAQLAKGKKSRP